MFVSLVQNVGLILAAALMQRFILDRWPPPSRRSSLLSGLLYGAAAVVAMSLAYTMQSGVIFDARTVVLSVGALFGGAMVAVVSSLVAIAYRVFYLGGAGAGVGVAVILTAACLGVIVRYACRQRVDALRHWQFLLLGLVVHVLGVAWFALLPVDYVNDILLGLAPVYIPLLTFATLAMSLVLRGLNAMRDYEQSLLRSRSRIQHLFENAGVALLDEDLSDLFRALAALRDAGISDIRRYLAEWPDEVDRLSSLVRVVRANTSAVALFGVQSRTELLGHINQFFSEDARHIFVDEIVAIWRGDELFEAETSFIRSDGSSVNAILLVPVPQTGEAARHVPVSLVNMTAVRQRERELELQKQRLEEVIWGTDAGTWVWNIASGDVFFNERWANIVGYSLEELLPTTLETWARLAHPDDLERSRHALSRVLAGETTVYECEIRLRHRDGNWIRVLDRGFVVEWDASGDPLRMSGTHLNVTARSRAASGTTVD